MLSLLLRQNKKKFNLQQKFEGKAMKWFPINSSLSKRTAKINEHRKDKSSNGRISKGSINRGSAHELDRVSSLVQKLSEVTKVKDQLSVNNQTLKFKLAELQKEKYCLTQLNKKLSNEVSRNRLQDQDIVILKKKDFNILLHNYYNMAEELEGLNLAFSEWAQSSSIKVDLADQYLKNALEAEEALRQFKIKYY